MPETLSPQGASLPRRRAVVREYLGAFKDLHTYNLFRNRTALFGLAWGIPVPLFSMGFDLWLSGHRSFASCLAEHPIHFLFLVHPLLFAFLFGAFETIRRRKDAQIVHLVGEQERHVAELAHANRKLQELDRLKARFVANVTHELKTPLVAIRGYNETILEGRFGPLTDKQRSGLEVAVRNAERLRKLIEELLDFERIEAGALTIHSSEFDLIPVVASALEMFRPEIDSRRIAVELELPQELRSEER